MVEVLIAMALGTLVVGAAIALFTQSMQSTWMFTQRSEMQQGMRAGLNAMAQDLSIAGTGFPQGGVPLPSGTGSTASRFACDMNGPIVAGVSTPKCYVTEPALGQRLYAINPGKQVGPTINGNVNDAVTLVYSDSQLDLTGCTAKVTTRNNTGIVITLSACPVGVTPFDPTQGILVGDVILLTQVGTSTIAAGVVTAVANPTLSFSAGDPLNFNQPGAASGGPNSLPLNSTAVLTRLDLISYYIYSPAGVPILERQLGAKSPVPVADNVTVVNFWYYTVNGVTGSLPGANTRRQRYA